MTSDLHDLYDRLRMAILEGDFELSDRLDAEVSALTRKMFPYPAPPKRTSICSDEFIGDLCKLIEQHNIHTTLNAEVHAVADAVVSCLDKVGAIVGNAHCEAEVDDE